jgi:hypothetical protein
MNAVEFARRYNDHSEARSFNSSITSCPICSASGTSGSTVAATSRRYFPNAADFCAVSAHLYKRKGLIVGNLLIRTILIDNVISIAKISKWHTYMKIALSSFFGISRITAETYRIPLIRRYALLGVLSVAMLGLSPVRADASLPVPFWKDLQQLTSVAAAPGGGFWVQLDARFSSESSGTLAKDGAPVFEDVSLAASIAAIPGRNGYWVVTDQGLMYPRGDAPQLCERNRLSICSNFPAAPDIFEVIVGAMATPTGKGLWAVGRDGKVWTAGDAQSYGDAHDDPQVATGIVATPSGNGYYIVKEDGVYSASATLCSTARPGARSRVGMQ